MSLPPDTPQGVADALGYLQHHLHELTERQNVSENNINTTLAALTAQLQQLTQLVANPSLPPYQTPLLRLYHPLWCLHPLFRRQDKCVPSSLNFGEECHNSHAFLNSCFLYIRLALEQFHDEEERILWALTFFKSGHAAKWSKNVFRQEADTGVFPI